MMKIQNMWKWGGKAIGNAIGQFDLSIENGRLAPAIPRFRVAKSNRPIGNCQILLSVALLV